MAVISMKQLLEADVRFGHQTHRWNPRMKEYIFTERNGICIIDLQKTVKSVDATCDCMKNATEEDGVALFIGTKKQAQETIEDGAIRAGQYYVNHHWLGDASANWGTIRKRIVRLKKINAIEEDSTFEVLSKKEAAGLNKEHERLEKFLGSTTDMPRVPDVVYIVNPRKERIAAQETRKLNIPIVAMVGTNCDPNEIDVVIPSSDDATCVVKLITVRMADVFIESNQGEDQATEGLFVEETPEAASTEEIVDIVEGSNEPAEQ